MSAFELVSVLVTLTALCSYLNRRFLRLEASIGVMLVAMMVGLGVLLLGALGWSGAQDARATLGQLPFDQVLFQGLLSFLLFAGALSLDSVALWRQRTLVLTLALLSTVLSTLIVGGLTYLLLGAFGLEISLPLALLFGAIISPTDPVAVLALLKKAGLPERVQTLVAGESLLNDGVGVVLFVVLLSVAGLGGAEHHATDFLGALQLFALEAGGGVLFGALVGLVAYFLLSKVDDYTVEVLVTLAVVTGGYALATRLGVSGPLAMVIAGLIAPNRAVSPKNKELFEGFWHLTEEMLNALLFVLVGLEVLIVSFSGQALLLGIIAIPIALLARAVSVGLPIQVLRKPSKLEPYSLRLLVWGGLRGGIALALALAIPPEAGPIRETFLVMTYVGVVFSIVVQGLTMNRLAARASEAIARAPMVK